MNEVNWMNKVNEMKKMTKKALFVRATFAFSIGAVVIVLLIQLDKLFTI